MAAKPNNGFGIQLCKDIHSYTEKTYYRRKHLQIKREIGGQTFIIDLNGKELFEAYQEQQWLFDVAVIHQELESQPDTELIAQYGFKLSELEPLEEEMASKLRGYLNKEMSWEYALSDTIRSVAEQHKASSL